ncbi:MAG TPA: tetratricopeptide repeat protein, partial [Vicinamibacterales bacterium]
PFAAKPRICAGVRPSIAATGFLNPERGPRGELLFGFHDLIILRTAGELSSAKIPQRKVKRVLERLREQLPEGQSLTGIRISAHGDQVVVREGETVWNPESGQALFDFSVADLAAKAEPIDRKKKSDDEELDADAWYDLACDLELSSTEAARTAYERAIELDPNHADARVNLGRLLHEDGAPAAAEEQYRRALAADPEHETAVFNLGVALEDLGRLRDAREAYERALELDPDNADAHYNLAGILERRGDKPGALRHLKIYRKLKDAG